MTFDISLQALELELRQMGYSIDSEILQKCRSICNTYKITSSTDFVNQLHSYFLSHQESFADSNAKQLSEKCIELFKSYLASTAIRPLHSKAMYSKNTLNELEEDIFDLYCSSETKEKIKTKQFEESLRSQKAIQTHQELLCSPKSQPSSFSSRQDKGKIELSIKLPLENCIQTEKDSANFDISHSFQVNNAISDFKRYKNKVHSVFDVLNDVIEDKEKDLLNLLRKELKNDEIVFSHPLQSCTEEFFTAGMINVDSARNQVFLQTSKETGTNARVLLKLDQLESFALFTGRIIAIEGKNLDDSSISVSSIYTFESFNEESIAKLAFSNNEEQSIESSNENNQSKLFNGNLHTTLELKDSSSNRPIAISVACGPFCFENGLDFEVLDEFLLSVSKETEFVILMGPFLDENNAALTKGNISKFPEEILLEEIFEKRIFKFCSVNSDKIVIVIPSPKECSLFTSPGCMPQYPLKLSVNENYTDVPKNLHLLSNPADINLNGMLNIAMLNCDILFNLSKEEFIKNPSFPMDRMSRICSYLIEQRNYYPLIHPSNIEFELYNYLKIIRVPEIVIIPSNLRYFVKRVSGCIFVNPGQLCRSQSGGVYCTLRILGNSEVEVEIKKI